MTDNSLPHNTLAFLALSNEFCHALENCSESTREDFVDNMIRLLPRIYISANDLTSSSINSEIAYIPGALEEEYYDSVRRNIELLMGEHDTFLEVFVEDMKFSDTPIAASIAEQLADIFQELYNMLENVKDAPNEVIDETIAIIKEDFASFWSQSLCNVLRALNAIKYI